MISAQMSPISDINQNKMDYIRKMQDLLKDPSKFKKLSSDPTEKRETKLQSYLYRLKKNGHLDQDVYDTVRPS